MGLGVLPTVARADIYSLTTAQRDYRIIHFSNDGQFVAEYGAGGESAAGLDASSDGWIYYSNNILGGGHITRFRAGRQDHRQQVTPFGPGGSDRFNGPTGLTVALDGRVYAGSNKYYPTGVSGVFRYDPANGSFVPIVAVADTGLSNVGMVAVAPSGDIFLYRHGIGIERYAGDSGELVRLLIPTTTSQRLGDMEFGPDENLYVRTSHGVDRYNPDNGALIDHFVPNGAGGLNGAKDFDFGGDGFLYVNSADSILRFDATTGAFRDVFVAPDQYALAGRGGVREIAYVVPEPGVAEIVVLAAPLLARRIRRRARVAIRGGAALAAA